jgi:hypothetical protein
MKPSQTPETTPVLRISLRQLQRGGQNVLGGLFAADDLEQLHHVGRREEVRADDVLRTLRERGDLVHVERRRVRREDRPRLHDLVELPEHLFLDRHVLEDGLDDDVGLTDVVVGQGRLDQAHALLDVFHRHPALLRRTFVVLADRRHAAVERVLLHLEQLHRDAGIDEVHRDAAAHRAGADHRCQLDVAHRRVGRHVGNLARRTLAEERMAKRARLGRLHQVQEQLALARHSLFERQLDRSLDRLDASRRRREVLRHRARRVQRELQEGLGVIMLDLQVAHLRQAELVGNRLAGKRNGRLDDVAVDDLIEKLRSLEFLGLHRRARDDHVGRHLERDDARQSLRAAGAGQDAELDLGQRDLRAGSGHAKMAAKRQLEAAAHRNAVDRRDDRLARPLDRIRITVCSDGSASAFGELNSRMSAPPEKALPAPVMTIALTAASACARRRPSTIPVRSAWPRPLTGGLSMVITATSPWVAYWAWLMRFSRSRLKTSSLFSVRIRRNKNERPFVLPAKKSGCRQLSAD